MSNSAEPFFKLDSNLEILQFFISFIYNALLIKAMYFSDNPYAGYGFMSRYQFLRH